MNQLAAFRDTVALFDYRAALIPETIKDWPVACQPAHAGEMLRQIEANPSAFSDAKLGRWLGWLQGVMCAQRVMTLDEAKLINMKWAD